MADANVLVTWTAPNQGTGQFVLTDGSTYSVASGSTLSFNLQNSNGMGTWTASFSTQSAYLNEITVTGNPFGSLPVPLPMTQLTITVTVLAKSIHGQAYRATSTLITSAVSLSTLSGDAQGPLSSTEVVGILGQKLPSLPTSGGTYDLAFNTTTKVLSWQTPGSTGVNVQSTGSALPNNPYSTMNFTGALAASDVGGIATVTSSASAVGWTTGLDLDWTQGIATHFNSDGNNFFGGYTFTKINSANETTHASAGGGSGLAFAPSGGSSREWVNNNRTAPGMFLPMSNIASVSSVITSRTPLRFFVQVTGLSTQSSDSVSDGLAIALTHSAELTSSSGLRNTYAGYLGFSAGNAGLSFDSYVTYGTVNQGGISNEPGHRPTFDPTTVIVEMPGGIIGGIVTMYGIWSNSVVTPWPSFASFSPATCAYATNTTQGQLTERGWNGATNTLSGSTPGQWGILLAMQNNVSQSNTATITRMRVDYWAGL